MKRISQTEARERPILFSAPMVRALLDGRKTVTRRVMKPQPVMDDKGLLWWHWSKCEGSASNVRPGEPSDTWLDRCPYGQPGDRLWVRETWQAWSEFDKTKADKIGSEARLRLNYPADGNTWGARLRPSIHMPRWASRITLEVTDVRVERLQDISREDALAEGIQELNGRYTFNGGLHESTTPKESMRALWESINGAGTWDANPYVWVIEFKRVEAARG